MRKKGKEESRYQVLQPSRILRNSANGFDANDKVLVKSLACAIVNSIRSMQKRRKTKGARNGRMVTGCSLELARLCGYAHAPVNL